MIFNYKDVNLKDLTIPIDTNNYSILRNLNTVIRRYKNEATFGNEICFECEVEQVLSLVEVYAQIICEHNDVPGTHCAKMLEMILHTIEHLEEIEDISCECFPFDAF